jgi:hypothetical protein
VRVNFDLQDEFALHQPLSLWAVEAVGRLDDAEGEASQKVASDAGDDVAEEADGGDAAGFDPLTHALNVVSVIEAVQESPGVIMAAQVNRARDELMSAMKASGVEYEERMERLAQVDHPKPNRDWTYADFDSFRSRHPWVGSDNVKPKSIVREMFERAMTFGEYIQFYGLKRSEGVLLRYLSDVYKGLLQNVPSEHRTTDLDDVQAWLGAVVRQVDSSLIDEWERLLHPDEDDASTAVRPTAAADRTIVDDERAFRVMVRNTMFDWVQRLARRDHDDELATLIAPYWLEHDEILTGPEARAGELFDFDRTAGAATQILSDPDATNEWRIAADVDLVASAEEGRVVATITAVTNPT